MKSQRWHKSTIILSLSLFLSIISLCVSEDPHENNGEYSWQWQGQIIVTTIGIVLNLFSLDLLLTLDDTSKVSFYSLNVSLNVIDLLFILNRLVNASIHLSQGHARGNGDSLCFIDTIIDMTFVTWSASVIGELFLELADLMAPYAVYFLNAHTPVSSFCVVYCLNLTIYFIFLLLLKSCTNLYYDE